MADAIRVFRERLSWKIVDRRVLSVNLPLLLKQLTGIGEARKLFASWTGSFIWTWAVGR